MHKLGIVDWYEGMVIKPQHFQQSALSLMDQFGYIFKHATPTCYGIIDLELQSTLEGVFFLKKVECIMPDFSTIIFNADKNPSTSLTVNDEEFTIYLCINESNKFISQLTEPITDLHNPNSETTISRLSIQPFLSKDPAPISIPIARYANGKKSKYDPPRLFFADCTHTYGELLRLTERMTELLDQASLKHKKREAMNLYGAAVAKCLLIIRSALNDFVNPFFMYSTLATAATSLIGALDGALPSLNIKYDHSQIYQSFQPLLSFIEQKLDQIDRQCSTGIGKFRLIALNSTYAPNKSALVYSIMERNPTILLYVNQDLSYKDKIDKLTICCYSDVESNLLNRVNGCTRQIKKITELENEMMIELRVEYPGQNTELAIILPEDNFINNIYLG